MQTSSNNNPIIISSSSSVKEEFVKKWLKGVGSRYGGCKREIMSITERKNVIKLSADIAMASTTTNNTHDHDDASSLWLWRRSVMAKERRSSSSSSRCVMKKRNNICRGRGRGCGRPNKYYYKAANNINKRVVGSRREILKRLIPGGECMGDDNTLMKETLDYIQALQLQLQLMRHLASAAPTHHLSAR